jgi:lipopolysaccharide/colanic/teichoic acid biosynthesis glycosyltransferase
VVNLVVCRTEARVLALRLLEGKMRTETLPQAVMEEFPNPLQIDRAAAVVSMRAAAANSEGPVRIKRPGYLPIKSAIEWFLAALLFIPAGPFMLLLCAIVKITSPGPALYRQTRLGKGGRAYEMLKIRSMRVNAEAGTGAIWSGPNDSRVTRFGRFLRDTHLDELPQLVNILKGDMVLIGPRPERPELVERIERRLPRYRERLQVKPGVTGFAQIQHPADLDMDHVRRKLMYDLYYVKEIGIWLDLRIAVGTGLYFAGVTLRALGKMLIKGDGHAAEIEHEDMELLDEAEYPTLKATGTM